MPRKIIFLDRDGTINERPEKTRYVTKWEDFKFLPGAIEAMKMLYNSGYEIYLITNQAGVGRGFMSLEDLEKIHHGHDHPIESKPFIFCLGEHMFLDAIDDFLIGKPEKPETYEIELEPDRAFGKRNPK